MRIYMILACLVSFLWSTVAFARDFSKEELRQILVGHLNTGRVVGPVNDSNEVAAVQLTGKLIQGSDLSFGTLKAVGAGVGVVVSGAAGCIFGGFFGVGPPGCAIGAGIGTAAGAVLFNNLAQAANRPPPAGGDPFVEDLSVFSSLSIAGEGDVTDRLTTLASSNIQSQTRLNLQDLTISFVDPDVFRPRLLDSSGQIISQILGTDIYILDGPDGRALGFVSYNDPIRTGRAVTATDQFALDLSRITNQPPGTTFTYVATPLVTGDTVQPGLPLVNGSFGVLETTQTLDRNVCSPDAPAGTLVVRAMFRNFSTTTFSNLVVDVNRLTGGNVLCNAAGGPGRIKPTVLPPLQGQYSDSLLSRAEAFAVEFKIGLATLDPFQFVIDMRGKAQKTP